MRIVREQEKEMVDDFVADWLSRREEIPFLLLCAECSSFIRVTRLENVGGADAHVKM